MTSKILRIATRKSPLALWQAEYIGEKIKHFWPSINIEFLPLVTSGDKFLQDKLLAEGGKGLFVKELEEALLAKRADLAVHSMKDVPAFFPEGLMLAAISKRHSPFDAFIAKNHCNLQNLPSESKIGTSSLRRQAQLLAFRPDLEIVPLRGNINTRLDKLQQGEFDAIILAVAGLERMGLDRSISEILPEDLMLPACGQGALGIECRSDDQRILSLIAPLNDPDTALCVHTERQVNALLGGNCHVPLAVFCTIKKNKELNLRAKVFSCDGKIILSAHQQGDQNDSLTLADTCVKKLLDQGAGKLLSLNS